MVKAEPIDAPLLMTVRETARALGVCERTVWSMAGDGTLPRVELSKTITRFDQADILELIENRKHRGPSTRGCSWRSG